MNTYTRAADIPVEMIISRLNYDPLTGVFTWVDGRHEGRRAGWLASNGYRYINLANGRLLENRAAFVFMTGRFPETFVDHINGDPSDNRFSNLRIATFAQNQANQRKSRKNTSGLKGVSWSATRRKWVAQIQSECKHKFLGHYQTAEEAHEVYCLWADMLHGEFANHGGVKNG